MWEPNFPVRRQLGYQGKQQERVKTVGFLKAQRRADEAMGTQILNPQSAFDFLVDQSLWEDRNKDRSQISILDDK